MDCQRFLEGYSDFRDGLLPFEAAVEFEIHLDACASCGRYDRVVRRGASLYRDLPAVEPSEGFGARLQHRIHLEEEMQEPGRSASGIPASAALSIAAAVALFAWLPVVREDGGPEHLPAVAARAPQPPAELLVSGAALTHRAILDREGKAGATGHDHLLFGYFPVGAPSAIRIAAAD
jgi:hypothetical protein